VSIVHLARPEIQSLHAYEAAAQVDDTVRLNANESPHDSGVGGYRRPLNRYPEVRPQQLQQALAERFGCAPQQLLVTRGSSEAIDLLIRTFCRAGVDSIVMPSPSFVMYRHFAAVQGAEVIEVPATASRDYVVDVDELLAACVDTTKIIFVCSPNNPTGSTLPRVDIERLLRERGDRSAVVIDEAYIEFGRAPSATELLDEHPNLLVLRTLSKGLAFAGARCGAVAGPDAIIRMLSAVQAPYALSTPVVECVEDALRGEQLTLAEQAIERVIAERKRVVDAVGTFGFVEKTWPSDANFFLMKVEDAPQLMRHCEKNKVLLRYYGDELPNCIRVSIGSVAENDRLLNALTTFKES